ncbi:SSI family serine proteinase inhibitor [Streptomyces sp. NPDC050263]|uniref:SSI family serine proteinase inhibitor n=1 Tax=Streptomyces sp. NPDC050263 TaxID=3155037 RepID=UPI00344A7C5C
MFQVTPLRRLAVTVSTASAVCAAVVASSGLGPVAHAGTADAFTAVAPPPVRDEDRVVGDHLTVTVRHGGGRVDGTFEVYCHPGRGSHPDVGSACRAVDRNTRWGRDAFAPVPGGGVCTMRYGGPATAHVTGRWAGRPVDATYDRSNGCEIERWDRLVPLLPDLRPAAATTTTTTTTTTAAAR